MVNRVLVLRYKGASPSLYLSCSMIFHVHAVDCALAYAQVAAEVVGAWVRRPVYFGSSVVGVCRGMRQAEVTRFFSDGLLCVRAFDPITSEPPIPCCACRSCFSAPRRFTGCMTQCTWSSPGSGMRDSQHEKPPASRTLNEALLILFSYFRSVISFHIILKLVLL